MIVLFGTAEAYSDYSKTDYTAPNRTRGHKTALNTSYHAIIIIIIVTGNFTVLFLRV